MKKMTNEVKAGVVIVAAILLAILFFLKTTTLYTSTYGIKTHFKYAGDIKTDAVVKLSGIEVGRVKDIKILYAPETLIECILEIDRSAKVRKDSIAYVSTSGLVGDAFVGLTPGTSSEFVKKGDTISSEDPMEMRIMMKNLDATVNGVKSIVVDNKQGIDNIVKNLESTSENIDEFSEDVKKNPWKLLFKPQ
ncbi:MAG: MlaD family protein [Candidatus Omnitrophota bacterium]